jgi:alpha-tubulin suppressor-like RCC1 family protein
MGLGNTNNRYQFELIDKWYDGGTQVDTPFITKIEHGGHYWRGYYGTYFALTSGGEVFSWGYNAHGQCGHGHNNTPVTRPTKITALGPDTAVGTGTAQVSAIYAGGGYGTTFAICTGGQVFGWGRNYNWQLGIGEGPATTSYGEDKHSPTGPIQAIHGTVKMIMNSHHTTGHYPDYMSSFALLSSGRMFSCGRNHTGGLGQGKVDADGWQFSGYDGSGSDNRNRMNGCTHWRPMSACDYWSLDPNYISGNHATGSSDTHETWTLSNHGFVEGEPIYLTEYSPGSLNQGKTGTTSAPHIYWVGFDGVTDTTNSFKLYHKEDARTGTSWLTYINSDITQAKFSRVVSMSGIKDFAIGDNYYPHGVALSENGDVWTWGRNYRGQLGLGHRSNLPYSSTDVNGNTQDQVCAIRLNTLHNSLSSPYDGFDIRGSHHGAPNKVVKIEARGAYHDYSTITYLQDDDGNLYGTGHNYEGEIPASISPQHTTNTWSGRDDVTRQYFRKIILPFAPSELAEWQTVSFVYGHGNYGALSIRSHDGKVFWAGAANIRNYASGYGQILSDNSQSSLNNYAAWLQTVF